MTKKLYLVKCRGMTSAIGSDQKHGVGYVVAEDPDEAYRKVRDTLNRLDLGFSHDRVLHTVELLAEEGDYPESGIRLYA